MKNLFYCFYCFTLVKSRLETKNQSFFKDFSVPTWSINFYNTILIFPTSYVTSFPTFECQYHFSVIKSHHRPCIKPRQVPAAATLPCTFTASTFPASIFQRPRPRGCPRARPSTCTERQQPARRRTTCF